MITIFENYNDENLKRVGKVVLCIKDYITKTTSFQKGKHYNVEGLAGDPEKAEDDGFDYLPLKYTIGAVISDDNKNIVRFKIENKSYPTTLLSNYPSFYKYFEIPAHVADSEKYNL